jgi:hypothetical protein
MNQKFRFLPFIYENNEEYIINPKAVKVIRV